MDPAVNVEASNVVLYCARWRATVDFYRDVIGLPVQFENDWFVEFQPGDGSGLSIADAARATVQAADGDGITITWRVADVQVGRAALVARGVVVTDVGVRFGGEVCYFHDPEGHRIELWTPLPGES